MRKKDKGFTLVELLAVIVILALILIIAIPSVLSAMRSAQKESFYLYAQSLQSKALAQYTQDLEHNKDNTDCVVYDIGEDLGISNTGDYEGWVKVNRTPVESGNKNVTVSLSNSSGLQYVKYCVADGSSCTPDTSFYVTEGATSTEITKSLQEGEVLCANYQYLDGDSLKTASNTCKTYASGDAVVDTYEYNVEITLKDDAYAVENVAFNDDMSMDEFYAAISEFNENHKNDANKLAISAPSCSATGDDVKGTTTTRTTQVTTTTTADRDTTRVTTTTTTRNQTGVTTTTTTTRRTEQVTTTTTGDRPTENVSTTTTTERPTTSDTTTTINIEDRSLLLASLSVSGYDDVLAFSPYKFYYDLRVPNSVTSLNVTAVVEEPETSEVYITGAEALNVGTNPVVATVFNTITGERSYYRIMVTRLDESGNVPNNSGGNGNGGNGNSESGKPDPTLAESNASLSYLGVSGYSIDFDPEVYEYTLTTRGEDHLFINYETASETAHVALTGNEELQNDDQIVLFVQSENGFYNKTYTITVKFAEEESETTKVLRGFAVGLGVLLLIILTIVAINKRKKVVLDDDDKKDEKEQQNNHPEDSV